MRKVIWCGTGMFVCGAVAVLVAARYAAEHPDSFLGRCACIAGEVGARCNPLATFKPMCRVDDAADEDHCPTIPGPETPWEEHPEPPIVGELPEVSEPIVIDSPRVAYVGQQTNEPDAFRADEESTDLPIPLARPELAQQDNLPYMPYAEEDAGTDDSIADLSFRSVRFFVTNLCLGSCQELSRMIDEVLHDFGTEQAEEGIDPKTYSIPEPIRVIPAESQSPEDATTSTTDTGTADEDEETSPLPDALRLQEDRSYHQQYPGCPYTGHCPYPYYYNYMPTREPAPREEETPSPVPEKSSRIETEAKTVSFFKSGLDLVHPSGVDTMECRPSDLPVRFDDPF